VRGHHHVDRRKIRILGDLDHPGQPVRIGRVIRVMSRPPRVPRLARQQRHAVREKPTVALRNHKPSQPRIAHILDRRQTIVVRSVLNDRQRKIRMGLSQNRVNRAG
jgi:hypothetical protein